MGAKMSTWKGMQNKLSMELILTQAHRTEQKRWMPQMETHRAQEGLQRAH